MLAGVMHPALEGAQSLVIRPYRKGQAVNLRSNYTHSGSIISIVAIGAAGVVIVVGLFWHVAMITVKGGVVDMIGMFRAVSVFSSSSILKRVESSRMDALTDGDGDSKFDIFRLFFDGRDEPSFSSDLRIRCIHDP